MATVLLVNSGCGRHVVAAWQPQTMLNSTARLNCGTPTAGAEGSPKLANQ